MASYEPEEEEEEVPQQIQELAQSSAPSSLRGIRACKRCGILKTLDQFLNEGCENCPFLDMVCVCCVVVGVWMRTQLIAVLQCVLFLFVFLTSLVCFYFYKADNPERANICTSAFYEGQAAVMDPRESWAAKWIRVDNCLPGVYAIAVTGQLDRDIEEDLENRGIRWRCRPVGHTGD